MIIHHKIPLWLIVQDGTTVIHLIVITVKYCSTGVVCAVSSISIRVFIQGVPKKRNFDFGGQYLKGLKAPIRESRASFENYMFSAFKQVNSLHHH